MTPLRSWSSSAPDTDTTQLRDFFLGSKANLGAQAPSRKAELSQGFRTSELSGRLQRSPDDKGINPSRGSTRSKDQQSLGGSPSCLRLEWQSSIPALAAPPRRFVHMYYDSAKDERRLPSLRSASGCGIRRLAPSSSEFTMIGCPGQFGSTDRSM